MWRPLVYDDLFRLAERHSTTLHISDNGLDYRLAGIILDHQNKDMLFFEGWSATASWH